PPARVTSAALRVPWWPRAGCWTPSASRASCGHPAFSVLITTMRGARPGTVGLREVHAPREPGTSIATYYYRPPSDTSHGEFHASFRARRPRGAETSLLSGTRRIHAGLPGPAPLRGTRRDPLQPR